MPRHQRCMQFSLMQLDKEAAVCDAWVFLFTKADLHAGAGACRVGVTCHTFVLQCCTSAG